MKYWMAIFNQDTWREFIDMPVRTCAFGDNPTRRFPTISVDDRLLCYVAKVHTWTGVLKVTGERYRATADTYPNKIPVEPEVLIADPALGVPMTAIRQAVVLSGRRNGKDVGSACADIAAGHAHPGRASPHRFS